MTLEVESIDRMYLNVYIPKLQRESGASWFLKQQRQYPVASSAAMAPISRAFVEGIETYAKEHQIPMLTFAKGERKDDVVAPYVKQAAGREGIVLIGNAQEKTTTFRTTKGQGARSADRYPRLYRTTAMVNQYYFYGVDADFGSFFFKFSSYFPYIAKFCLNGHEYLKQQLAQAGIAYEALDSGILSCADPVRMQSLAEGLATHQLRALLAPLLGLTPDQFTQGQMTYHLRRLRLHGLIQRIPQTHRYQVTDFGWRVAFFFTRLYASALRPGLAQIVPQAPPLNHRLSPRFDQLDLAINDWIAQANLTS